MGYLMYPADQKSVLITTPVDYALIVYEERNVLIVEV